MMALLVPVMINVIAGIENVPEPIVDAARGTGMGRMQRFEQVQLPLGAMVGAGGLGVPIVAGAGQFNPALVLEGAIPSALLALIIDRAL